MNALIIIVTVLNKLLKEILEFRRLRNGSIPTDGVSKNFEKCELENDLTLHTFLKGDGI